jgi:tRNA (guanine-N7-)-methyltransferase
MARKLNEYPSVVLRPEDLNGRIDFFQIFGRPGPIHIEIGTGKATFLLNYARKQPCINLIGIERANKYYRYAVDRIGRWGQTNVRIIRADAAVFLANSIPDNSVDCFHIYFPDPWPKRRHHKRRFLSPENLSHLVRCLKTGGQLRIATDHAEYFQQIQRLIANQNRLVEVEFIPAVDNNATLRSGASILRPLGTTEDGSLRSTSTYELTGTNYERKYLKDKRKIYTLAVMKTRTPQ